jgi:hypothetical protein
MSLNASALDVIDNRLRQARGILVALLNGFDEKTGEIVVPDRDLYDTIDATIDLLKEAEAARRAMIDAEVAKRGKAVMDVL